jgi:3-oxoacyl-[acyl-carrier-protein] synthase-3
MKANKLTAAITAVGGYVPPDVLSNKDLESIIETSDAWITSRTGIQERRILKQGASSDMGVAVLKELCEKSGTSMLDIDLVIVGTITPDYIFPSNANVICDKAGAKNAWGFDLGAACSGFLYALSVGSQFIETGKYKKVAVIGMDKMSSIVDYEDRNTCVIFGDGAAGVLLEPNAEGFGVQDFDLYSDGKGRELLYQPAGGSLMPPSEDTVKNRLHYLKQDGKTVFKHAVTNMGDATIKLMQKHNLTAENLDWFVPHQANMRIIDAVADYANFPKEKIMINIARYGNTTAATLPLCFWDYENQLKKGDKVVLAAFGGGFTWGAVYLTWAY